MLMLKCLQKLKLSLELRQEAFILDSYDFNRHLGWQLILITAVTPTILGLDPIIQALKDLAEGAFSKFLAPLDCL